MNPDIVRHDKYPSALRDWAGTGLGRWHSNEQLMERALLF